MTATALPAFDTAAVLGQGGFGTVYAGRDGHCVKVFRARLAPAPTLQLRALTDLVERCRPSDREILTTRFAWPTEILGDVEAEGFEMARVPAAAMFELTVAGRTTSHPLQAKYLIDAQYWRGRAVTSAAPGFDADDRIEACLDLYGALSVLHGHRLAYRDLSANNVCFTTARPRRVFLLDADSVVDADRPLPHGGASPDWDVPPAGLLEQDRARFALLTWRLFVQDPTARPDRSRRPGCGLDDRAVHLISRCHRTGDLDAFEQLAARLRDLLSPARRATLRLEAERSGFARFVVRSGASDADDAIFAMAALHMQAEDLCATATGARRRMHRRALGRHPAPFLVDVAPDDGGAGITTVAANRSSVPTSREELHRWFSDARFEELAELFACGRLEPFADDRWLERALGHAFRATGAPTPKVTAKRDCVEVDVCWPSTTFVNHTVVALESGGSSMKLAIARPTDLSQSVRVAPRPPGSVVQWTMWAGTRSPVGHTILDSRYVGGTTVTPSTASASGKRASTPNVTDSWESAARPAAAADRCRRRRALWWATSIGALILALAALLTLVVRPSDSVRGRLQLGQERPAAARSQLSGAATSRQWAEPAHVDVHLAEPEIK